MRVKEISVEEYEKLCSRFKGSRRIESPKIDPVMKSMTVQGRSGKGTPFKNEYERLMDEWRNPPNPLFITMHDVDETYIIKPKKA